MAKFIDQSYKILTKLNKIAVYKKLEIIARKYYPEKYKDSTQEEIIIDLIKHDIYDVLNHVSFTVNFTLSMYDRIIAFDKSGFSTIEFKDDVEFIKPEYISEKDIKLLNNEKLIDGKKDINEWYISLLSGERQYFDMVAEGYLEYHARKVLPLSVRTDIIYTGTLQEWKLLIKRNLMPDNVDTFGLFDKLNNELNLKLPLIF